ncbi:MAG: D-alanine--D-alanine ligase [Thermoleophilaceae bacterium]|nr:D-alanine--D-alanine ligase [Thermoleophilaceae bacterium]
MRVALLCGGRSSEHEVSRASAASVRAGLEQAGHEPVLIEIARDGRWSLDGEPVALRPGEPVAGAEVVFPVLHGPYGEDGTVQGLLETLGVPYVGAGVLASALCMDKAMFKALMAQAGIPQVDYEVLRRGDDLARAARLGMPVFVKPARLGSSVGISKVAAEAELERALELSWRHDPVALVEAFSPGMEVECSVIGNDEPLASQPGEVVAHAEWYDYEAKYTPGGMELVVPARLDEGVRERVRELAVDVYRLVGCSGFARVDFFVEDGTEVLVNELNTIPGFTATSGFPKLFEASGIPYPELLDRLLALALERFEAERGYRF